MIRVRNATVLTILILLQNVPLVWMLITALKPESGFLVWDGSHTESLTLSNFARLFKATDFPRWCLNSLIVGFIAAGLAAVAGNLFAFSLRFRWGRFYEHLRGAVLAAYLIPSMFLVLAMQWLFPSVSDASSFITLPFVYQVFLFPICVWIGASYVDRIPRGAIATVQMDGIGIFESIRLVYMPYASKAIWVSFILCFVLAMQEYVYAFLLVASPHWHTLPVGIAAMQAGDIYEWSLIAAAGASYGVIALIALVLCSRVLSRGLSQIIHRLTIGARQQ